jgi:hypothetical protein
MKLFGISTTAQYSKRNQGPGLRIRNIFLFWLLYPAADWEENN